MKTISRIFSEAVKVMNSEKFKSGDDYKIRGYFIALKVAIGLDFNANLITDIDIVNMKSINTEDMNFLKGKWKQVLKTTAEKRNREGIRGFLEGIDYVLKDDMEGYKI